MKILVTGATGFVGSHLCELLESTGHQVYSLVRTPKKAKEFKVVGHYISGSLKPKGELLWIKELPNDLDAVIHTAGIVHSTNTKDFDDINHFATVNLVHHLKNRFRKLHFTFVSSLAAGGPTELLILRTEQTPDQPVSQYGRSKNEAEKSLMEIIPTSWTTNTLRPPMVIGPRDPAVLDLFKMVKSGLVVGPGLNFKTKEYSFIGVFDLIDALKELTVQKPSGLFYISHDLVITFEQLINTIKLELKKKFLLFIPIPSGALKIIAYIISKLPISSRLTVDKVNELLPMAWTCSNERLQEHTSFKPSWDIKRIIAATHKDYQNRNWL